MDQKLNWNITLGEILYSGVPDITETGGLK